MFTVTLQADYLYVLPLLIDAFHDLGGGWLSHLRLSYCTHLPLHLLAPVNTWQLISSFSQLQCYSCIVMCSVIHTHNPLASASLLSPCSISRSPSLMKCLNLYWHQSMCGPLFQGSFYFYLHSIYIFKLFFIPTLFFFFFTV